MKYVILSYATQHDHDDITGTGEHPWTGDEIEAMRTYMSALNDELAESGELVETGGLEPPRRTRRVSASPYGEPLVTDDPFAPTHEVVAAYWMVECAGLDRATEIANQINACPAPAHARRAYADIRPIAKRVAFDAE